MPTALLSEWQLSFWLFSEVVEMEIYGAACEETTILVCVGSHPSAALISGVKPLNEYVPAPHPHRLGRSG